MDGWKDKKLAASLGYLMDSQKVGKLDASMVVWSADYSDYLSDVVMVDSKVELMVVLMVDSTAVASVDN